MQKQRLYVLDPDLHRRHQACRIAFAGGFDVEPCESVDELIAMIPKAGVVLAPMDSGQIAAAMSVLDRVGIWLPIVEYGQAASNIDIVRAVIDGAAGFLPWPFDEAALSEAVALAGSVSPWGFNHQHNSQYASATKLIDALTYREKQVLDLIVDGFSSVEVGQLLSISSRTVEVHRSNVMRKLGARRLADTVRVALEARLSKNFYQRPITWDSSGRNEARSAA